MAEERVLVVEDEAAVARSLGYALRSEGFRVILAETGQQALDKARGQNPHLILLDLRLPDISGFDVCRILRTEGKRMPIIMLTALDEEVDRVLGLELGADDYVVKPYSLREVISRIRAQLRRSYGDLSVEKGEERLQFGSITIDVEHVQVHKGGERLFLTPTEFRLLRHLVDHPNQPLSRQALIEAVWGYSSEVGDLRTVDVHIRHLRQKIEDDPSTPRWIVTMRGLGYKFNP